MSEPMLHPVPQDEGPGLKIPILFGIVLALVASNVYLFLQLDKTRTEMAQSREQIMTELSNLRETSVVSSQNSKKHLDSLRADLDAAQRRANALVGAAKEEALAHAEELTKKIEEEQQRQQQQVAAELNRVEESASNKVAAVSSEVGNVKKDVAANRTDLEKTIADLKRANGDLGVQSGLIATNGRELAALKALGDRSYYEFNLTKTKQPQRLGDITVLLKKTDEKHNKYTIEVVADDKQFEKKDKNVNEPVQFYMSKYRQPCEIVVNEIKKDRIVGYLSQPKVLAAASQKGT